MSSSTQLKRSQEASGKNGPPAKRRNTGYVAELRRHWRSDHGGISNTDPLNVNSDINEPDGKRSEDAAPLNLYQRRLSFRCPSRKPTTSAKAAAEQTISAEARKQKQQKMNARYRYGNFNYFHKQKMPFNNDPRTVLLCEDWFAQKDILDVGCNSGLLTISIARSFSPKSILGIDIDSHLIGAARKNVRHINDKANKIIGKFPASFPLKFGPISAPSTSQADTFPDNIWFEQGNYVLNNDAELDNVKEEYDTIVALAITKWIHLNWGDDGIKRFFRRVYLQLRAGGKFVLEPQASAGYRKRASMHPEMEENYRGIKMWPDRFREYLLSAEVGFEHCEIISSPLVDSLGFDGPLLLLYKGPLHWGNMAMPARDGLDSLCDGWDDCSDGSDESNCEPIGAKLGTFHRGKCGPRHFQCEDIAGNMKCIREEWRCDGHSDCRDNTDELECNGIGREGAAAMIGIRHLESECSESQFRCSMPFECVPMEVVCNGRLDCHDGSDEGECEESTTISTEKSTMRKSGTPSKPTIATKSLRSRSSALPTTNPKDGKEQRLQMSHDPLKVPIIALFLHISPIIHRNGQQKCKRTLRSKEFKTATSNSNSPNSSENSTKNKIAWAKGCSHFFSSHHQN